MNALLVNFKARTVTETAEIMALQAEVLARAEAVQQVTTPDEQDKAVEAQASLARYIRACDNSAEAAKKPVNEIRKKIIDWNKEMVSKADEAGGRLAQMVNEFQLAESRRVTAAKRAQDETTSVLTREMEQKVATATSLDAQEAIREEYRDRLAAEATPIPNVPRSEGQRVTNEWEIECFDLHALFRAYPLTCKLTPILTEIKMLLDQDITPPGVRAKKVIKSGVRLAPERKSIDV